MWIERLLDSPARQALELTARYAERRHALLAENLANIDTPDYQTRRLDARQFQQALSEAWQRAEQQADGGSSVPRLELRGRQVCTTRDGALEVRPEVEPAANVLLHDGTNARLEELIAEAGENALTYQFAIARLKAGFEALMSAIRGKVT
jgi:flagellar basal-body rod protein FlgB